MANVLAVTNDDQLRQALVQKLRGLDVSVVPPEMVLAELKCSSYDVLLVDSAVGLQTFEGIVTSAEVKEQGITTIALVPPDQREVASLYIKRGASQYLLLPPDPDEIQITIQREQQQRRSTQERDALWTALRSTSDRLKETEQEIERKITEIAKLYRLGHVVNLSYVLIELLQTIVRTVCENLSCERCSIALLDRSGKDQIIHSVKDADGGYKTRNQVYSRGGVTREVIALGEPVLVEDVQRDERFSEDLFRKRPYNTRSFISAPITIKGGILAVINAADKANGAVFTTDDLTALTTIAGHIGRALGTNMPGTADVPSLEQLLLQGTSAQNVANERDNLSEYLRETSSALERTRLELDRKQSEISVLYNVGKVIRATFAIEELLRMIVDMVTQSLRCRRGSILLIDNQDGDILVKGVLGKDEAKVENRRMKQRGRVTQHILAVQQSLLVNRDDEEEHYFSDDIKKGYCTRSFLSVPIKIQDQVVAILNVTDRETGASFTEDDQRLLEMLADQAAITIENFRLSEQLVEKERMERELQIAHSIQVNLLPEQTPQVPGAELEARSIPAKAVGGDYYDVFQVDDDRWGFVVADVSGKGVPAALLMVMIRSLLRAAAAGNPSPADVVGRINRMILPDLDTAMFVTLFYGIYEVESRRLVFSNAGHNRPLHISGSTGESEELGTEDMFVGMFEDYTFSERSVTLAPGDLVVFYTDGITEARNETDEGFGVRRLLDIIAVSDADRCSDLVRRVFSYVFSFAGSRTPQDDMTLMVMRAK